MTLDPKDVRRIAVVGAGTMGPGIALVYTLSGWTVSLYDVDADALDQARQNVKSVLKTFTDQGRLADEETDKVLSRLTLTTVFEEAIGDADFVTEAVPETIELKKEVFANLDRHTDTDVVLATNTSGLSITEIATAVEDPSRVIGTHWFNPPYIVPLVEVIPGDGTDISVVKWTSKLLKAVGKTPVALDEEIPGFIANRIQMAMAYEAFSLLNQGVASAEEIDQAVRASFGFRLPVLGIFEKVDQSGVDVHYDVESYLMDTLDRGTEPNPVVSRLVESGHEGLKTGRGVYDWSHIDPEDVYEDRDRHLLAVLDAYEEREGTKHPSD